MSDLITSFGGACVRCGSDNQLQFDHVDWRTKKFTIATCWSMKDREVFALELTKCQLLCSECHTAKTKIDNSEMDRPEFTHGTVYAWMKRKCDCEVCSAAKILWNNARNERRRGNGPDALIRGKYQTGPADHGTYRRYKQGCKCAECKSANARKVQEQKAAKSFKEVEAS